MENLLEIHFVDSSGVISGKFMGNTPGFPFADVAIGTAVRAKIPELDGDPAVVGLAGIGEAPGCTHADCFTRAALSKI